MVVDIASLMKAASGHGSRAQAEGARCGTRHQEILQRVYDQHLAFIEHIKGIKMIAIGAGTRPFS